MSDIPIKFDRKAPALGDDSDQSLLARLHRRESAAFDELVALYQPRIARLVQRLLGWNSDVEDVMQDVFLAAHQSIRHFRGDASINTWLTQVALNICRSRQRRKFLSLRWMRRQKPEIRAENGASSLEKDELSQRVRQAMQKLNHSEREVIVLYYLEERSGKEIAELLSITPPALDVRLHRVRRKLKELLKDVVEETDLAR